ncbi:MAG: MerR family transcriptional regulator [Clostridia bacterium]|nr:MerR family transcriptional regulator [Clostridia bacterium]
MSKYTTGELAKLTGVSVRTVQYYDQRNILTPSELSEGGRRLYSEEDLKKMKIICFLREAGLSINGIGELFSEEQPERVIEILLAQQEEELKAELQERKDQLALVTELKRELKSVHEFSVESIGDIALLMESKKKLAKMRWLTVLTGIPVTALQWTSIVLWITNGLWWLFLIWDCVAIPWGICVSVYYFKRVAYICPQCHEVFKPKFREVFWAYHTPRTRRLTCPHCGRKGMCVETYAEAEK